MVNNDLHVTERAVRAYNLCDRKAYLLIFSPSLSSPNAYEILQTALSNNVRLNYFDSISDQIIVESFSSLSILKAVEILTDVNLSVEIFSIKNETLIKAPDVFLQDKQQHEPIIFSSSNKIQAEDKVELAYIGYVLSKHLDYMPNKGHVVLIDGSTVKVKLAENIKKCLPIIEALQGWLNRDSGLPPVTLNKHCPYCEFQKACKETAVQEDSLSLLGGITKKQILKFEKKGIFTIKQLSFLYRPRKRGRRSRVERVAHKFELQALALRTGNIYIQDNPVEIPKQEVEIFIDFECLPDESFFYLFGLVVCQADKQDHFQFWATSKKNEESAWKDFLSVIGQYGHCLMFHYGSFEKKAILTLGERYDPNQSHS